MASSSLQGFEVSFAKTDFDLCVLCQTKKGGLSGTDVGQNNIVTASNKYQDKLFDDVGKDDLSSFKYHMKCYRSYVRHFDHVGDISNNENNSTTDEDLYGSLQISCTEEDVSNSLQSPPKRIKRNQSSVGKLPKLCIICNLVKHKNCRTLHRICEYDRAQMFLDARMAFLDDVYTRTSTIADVKDLYAADVLCHDKCMNNYLLRYKRLKTTKDTPESTVSTWIGNKMTLLIK